MEAGCGSENVYGRPVINQITNFRGDFCIKKFLNEINKPFSLFNFSPLDFYLFYRISLHPPPHFSQRRWGDPVHSLNHIWPLWRAPLCVWSALGAAAWRTCVSHAAFKSLLPISQPVRLKIRGRWENFIGAINAHTGIPAMLETQTHLNVNNGPLIIKFLWIAFCYSLAC